MKLISSYSDFKTLSKDLYPEDDFRTYNANDFELALYDYSTLRYLNNTLISSPNNRESLYKTYYKNLNWFQFEIPTLYTENLDSYSRYLTYVMLITLLKTGSLDQNYLERYFTDQISNYIIRRSKNSLETIHKLYEYWKQALGILEHFINLFKSYEHCSSSLELYFQIQSKEIFKLTLPLVCWNKDPSLIDVFLILPFYDRKPAWYTIPSIYKIYAYFANHDIKVNKMTLCWFDMDNFFSKIIYDTIPLTENVATMVDLYSKLEPFPAMNIFDKNNSVYYNNTPLKQILK